jgi:hypothetical protein
LQGGLLSAGRDAVSHKRNKVDLPKWAFGNHFGRKLRVTWSLRAKCNRNLSQDSHFENLSPKSGTLFPALGNVKQKQLFGIPFGLFGLTKLGTT